MRLILNYDPSAWAEHSHFISQRQYVARTLVPKGFEDYFRQKARYISAHTSVRIEGNMLSEDDALQVMVEGPNEDEPEEIEAANVSEANDLVAQLASDRSVQIDNGLIRALNSVVLKSLPDAGAAQRGKYRDSPALIVDHVTRDLRYRPPPHLWVPELMDGLVKSIWEWREQKIDGPIIAALAHFALISIHPFADGNGRTSRLVGDLILEQTDWSVNGMISMSQTIDRYREDYYSALRDAQGLDFAEVIDVTPFLRFHTQALQRASVALEEHAAAFGRRLQSWLKLTEGRLNDRQARGFIYLLDMRFPLSSSRYAELSDASQSSAISDLNDLVAKGYVEKIGNGKLTRYKVASALEAFLDEDRQSDTRPTAEAV